MESIRRRGWFRVNTRASCSFQRWRFQVWKDAVKRPCEWLMARRLFFIATVKQAAWIFDWQFHAATKDQPQTDWLSGAEGSSKRAQSTAYNQT